MGGSGSENANWPRRGRTNAAPDRWLGSWNQSQRPQAVARLIEAATAEGGDLGSCFTDRFRRNLQIAPSHSHTIEDKIQGVRVFQKERNLFSMERTGGF